MREYRRGRGGHLFKQRLVQSREGEDRRMHLVLLTKTGELALQRAWPLWQEAQSRIERAPDHERFDALLAILSAIKALGD